jgi:hypothetical protein
MEAAKIKWSIGFFCMLTVLLSVLKLAGVTTTCPWLWVFAPLWLPAAIIAVPVVMFFLFVLHEYARG